MKKTILALCSFSILAACSEPQTIVHSVPYQPTYGSVGDGNLDVINGASPAMDASGLGQEWPDYVLQVGIQPSETGDINWDSAGHVGGIPVFAAKGHMRVIASSGGVQVWAYAWLRTDPVTNLHTIDVALDIRRGKEVVRIRKNIQATTLHQSYGGSELFHENISFGSSSDLYALEVKALPGPGLISKADYAEGTGQGSDRFSGHNGDWGTTMPFEKSGGSLADVTQGKVGGGGLRDSTFHDPIRQSRGGFGKVVR